MFAYVNFNESLTNDVVSFEQLGPECMNGEQCYSVHVGDDLCAFYACSEALFV